MNCGEYRIQIGESLDGTLGADAQATLDAHLATCAACRGVQDDLRRIRSLAGTLDAATPPPTAWPRIKEAIESQHRRGSAGRTRLRTVLAAAAVIALLAGGTWAVRHRQAPAHALPPTIAQQQIDAANAKAAASAESEIQQAEAHYNKAITSLEQITKGNPGALDAQTTAELQKNLGVIDTAIGESQQALHADPSNDMARQSLFDALRSKVALLEDTVALINEMRKGNQEGAARIVSGMKP